MSADNGIYILITKGPEYRVAYASAIDNIYWDEKKNQCGSKITKEANGPYYFGDSEVLNNRLDALKKADKLYAEFMKDEFGYLEYGISILDHSDQEFPR